MMNPVYVHENPGPFPAIKKSLRKKRDVYFRILGAMRHTFGVRVQKVQRVLKVQRVVVSPTAMSMYGCSAALVGAL